MFRYLLEAKSDDEVSRVFTSTFLSTARNILVFTTVFILVNTVISIKYAILIVTQLIIMVIYDTWQQFARGMKKNSLFSLSGIIYTIVLFVCNILFIVILNMKVEALLYSNIIAGLAAIVLIELRIGVLRHLKIKRKYGIMQKELLRYSIPLMPNAMNWWIISISSKYLINHYLGTAANGIYAVACKFPSIVILFDTIFNLAWQESAITEYNSADKNVFYTKMFRQFMKLQLTAILILIPLTRLLMRFMVEPSYFIAWKYTPMLYLGTIFTSFSTFYATGYLVSKETKGALVTSLLCISINLITCITLIRTAGIHAAAIAGCMAFFGMWVLRYYQIKKYCSIEIDKKLFGMLSALIIMFIVIYYYTDSDIICAILTVFGIMVFALCNFDIIMHICSFINGRLKKNYGVYDG